jgi:hypothetical protein
MALLLIACITASRAPPHCEKRAAHQNLFELQYHRYDDSTSHSNSGAELEIELKIARGMHIIILVCHIFYIIILLLSYNSSYNTLYIMYRMAIPYIMMYMSRTTTCMPYVRVGLQSIEASILVVKDIYMYTNTNTFI